MESIKAQIVILGGGAAGLAAALALSKRGLRPIIVEARERLGGRILTLSHGAMSPIELGAEFLHGRPPEVMDMIASAKLRTCLISGTHWYLRNDRLVRQGEFWQDIEDVFEAMKAASQAGDMSFDEFAEHYKKSGNDERTRAVEVVRRYVEGFNAARGADVSVHWLLKEEDASDTIDGEHQLRFVDGYMGLIDWLEGELADNHVPIYKGTAVRTLRWSKGAVALDAVDQDGNECLFECSACVITLPLAILQASLVTSPAGGAGVASTNKQDIIQFQPKLEAKREPLSLLRSGQVRRVVLTFEQAFWQQLQLQEGDEIVDLFDMGFIHASGQTFPTWWTQNPMQLPFLTGWAAGPAADALRDKTSQQLLEMALESLSKIFRVPMSELRNQLNGFHTHNWETDPFARCAYSYTAKNGMDAAKQLAEPLENTLFFAGEATDGEGFSGTVHGAIRSGLRAAHQIAEAVGFTQPAR